MANWIGKARASMEKRGTVGKLHRATGTPEGEKIPEKKLAAAAARAKRTGDTTLAREVNFAKNVRK